MPTLTLGYSPCPNDTFMFDALVHHKVDTEGIEFAVVMEDVESLNRRALRNDLDVSKMSFAAYLKTAQHYILLNSGSALGDGVGPLVISNDEIQMTNDELSKLTFAIPGKNTTANFLFSIFFPGAKNKAEMIFSDIENAVLEGKADAGVIIHENRFTYEQKGLKKICDLGELWEKETGQPIPLGGIAVKRSLPDELKIKIDRMIRKSVEYAFENPLSSREYVRQHSLEMSEEVRMKHIQLYVNDYSVNLGEKGRKAIETFFSKALEAGMIEAIPENILIDNPVVIH